MQGLQLKQLLTHLGGLEPRTIFTSFELSFSVTDTDPTAKNDPGINVTPVNNTNRILQCIYDENETKFYMSPSFT